ncbi:glycosyltransferase family 8 protein [Hymenobacter lucidus]|uniref:Glycosyltransferase family 8 protein n=1 Tax=Hymenobacter lucidus TaxID=2880930 RepID=A0ABS8AQL0_9BACT|nr:glycosyltransferase family 8 protein [Hymenobacter lucidus]MCB2408510.1 glycosyltransferase family 8 protein [Hymenobacter lucidus]
MNAQPVIHAAIAFDEGYITPVYVLLTSIFVNNKDCQVQVHAIATDVSDTEKAKIVAYVRQQGGNMHFYELSPEVTEGFPVPDEQEAYITLATYYRLFFPRLIPQEIERLLYLDVDMLIVGNLLGLYQTDLGEYTVGAIMEAEMPLRPEIGMNRLEDYFNAGVLLMDMYKWREQHITDQALRIIATQPEKLQYHDQDALNMVFKGKWYRLDSRYNLMKAYIPYDLPKRDYEKFLQDKVIIHYNGRNKPWHRACENKFRFLYPQYLHQSPRAHLGRYMKKTITRKGLAQLFYNRILETYFDYPEVGNVWRRLKGVIGK